MLPWSPFLRGWTLAALATFLLLASALLILDPYDTGRLPLLHKRGTTSQGPRLANASRARDPAFDSAIFGNSHVQLLSPEELDRRTGLRFVSLIVPGVVAKEALVLLGYYLRNRTSAPRALVIGIDTFWCTDDPALPPLNPFPYWLYKKSFGGYLTGLLRYSSLERLPARAAYLLGRTGERARPDGYWDYEPNYVRLGYAAARARDKLAMPGSNFPSRRTDRFPAAEKLRDILMGIPPETKVVLVRPPVFWTALPQAEAVEREEARCREAFEQLTTERAGTFLVDWRSTRPENLIPENFFDHTHYRAPVARKLEADIAGVLNSR